MKPPRLPRGLVGGARPDIPGGWNKYKKEPAPWSRPRAAGGAVVWRAFPGANPDAAWRWEIRRRRDRLGNARRLSPLDDKDLLRDIVTNKNRIGTKKRIDPKKKRALTEALTEYGRLRPWRDGRPRLKDADWLLVIALGELVRMRVAAGEDVRPTVWEVVKKQFNKSKERELWDSRLRDYLFRPPDD